LSVIVIQGRRAVEIFGGGAKCHDLTTEGPRSRRWSGTHRSSDTVKSLWVRGYAPDISPQNSTFSCMSAREIKVFFICIVFKPRTSADESFYAELYGAPL